MAAGGIETEVFQKTTMTATRTTTASLFVGIILLLLLFCQRELTFKNLLISTTDPPHQIITTITTPKITITLPQLTLNLLLRIWRTAPADTTRHTTPHSLSIVSTTLTMKVMRGRQEETNNPKEVRQSFPRPTIRHPSMLEVVERRRLINSIIKVIDLIEEEEEEKEVMDHHHHHHQNSEMVPIDR